MSLTRVVSEIASEQALIPVLWLAWLHHKKRSPGVAYWWLSGIFIISWITDTIALWVDPDLIGAVYPVSQAAIVAAVFLRRGEAFGFVALLLVVGVADLVWQGVQGLDILLRTVAWLGALGIVAQLPQLGRLRKALAVILGVGWLAWMYYLADPGWPSYLTYQGVRLIGILLFCWAATSPLPQLKLHNARSA